MQLHQLQRVTRNKKKKRIGRGGKRGKTSGKGHKGQKARAGGRPRPEIRDVIKRIPKQRGYRFASVVRKTAPVNVRSLVSVVEKGDVVTPTYLFEKGLIRKVAGRLPHVKILGVGTVHTAYTVSGCAVSEDAAKKIEAAGGTIEK